MDEQDVPVVGLEGLVVTVSDGRRGQDPGLEAYHLRVDLKAPGSELRLALVRELLTPDGDWEISGVSTDGDTHSDPCAREGGERKP